MGSVYFDIDTCPNCFEESYSIFDDKCGNKICFAKGENLECIDCGKVFVLPRPTQCNNYATLCSFCSIRREHIDKD